MGKLDIHLKDWLLSMVRTFFRGGGTLDFGGETVIGASYPIQDITQAINELDDTLRIPFSMYLAGCTYQEIATRTNLPVATVKSRVYFAREAFTKRMKAEEYQKN